MCMLRIAKKEIVHKTYTKWFCFQRPDFWPWHQGQVQYKVFYCTSCLQGILCFFHFLFTKQIENCFPDHFFKTSDPKNMKYESNTKSESISRSNSNQNSNFEIQSRKQVPYLVFWMHKLCCCCTCAKNFSMRFDHFLTHLGKLTFIGLCAVLLRLFLKGHWIEHLC